MSNWVGWGKEGCSKWEWIEMIKSHRRIIFSFHSQLSESFLFFLLPMVNVDAKMAFSQLNCHVQNAKFHRNRVKWIFFHYFLIHFSFCMGLVVGKPHFIQCMRYFAFYIFSLFFMIPFCIFHPWFYYSFVRKKIVKTKSYIS